MAATPGEEELAVRVRDGDPAALPLLLASLQTWLGHIIRRFVRVNALADDLRQVGELTIWQATAKFQPARGVKFRQFAYQRVRGAMQDLLREEGTIHLPRSAFQSHRHVWRTRSLDALVSPSDSYRDVSAISQFVDPTQIPPDIAILAQEEIDRLYQALSCLPLQLCRMALYRWEGSTMSEIGSRVGCSESRVSQRLPAVLTALQVLVAAQARAPVAGTPLSQAEATYLRLAHKHFPPEVLAQNLRRPVALVREFCRRPTLAGWAAGIPPQRSAQAALRVIK